MALILLIVLSPHALSDDIRSSILPWLVDGLIQNLLAPAEKIKYLIIIAYSSVTTESPVKEHQSMLGRLKLHVMINGLLI